MSKFNCVVVEAKPISIRETCENGKAWHILSFSIRGKIKSVDISFKLLEEYLNLYEYSEHQRFYMTYNIHSKKQP